MVPKLWKIMINVGPKVNLTIEINTEIIYCLLDFSDVLVNFYSFCFHEYPFIFI